MVWVASKIEPNLEPMISEETIWSSLYPKDSVAAAFIAALMPSTVACPLTTATKIVVEPVGVGTR